MMMMQGRREKEELAGCFSLRCLVVVALAGCVDVA